MKPAKIRLIEPSFIGYTGVLCGVQFKDGISVKDLPFIDQQRICASMRAMTLEGENASPSAAYGARHTLSADKVVEKEAPEIVPLKRGKSEEEKKVQHFSRAD